MVRSVLIKITVTGPKQTTRLGRGFFKVERKKRGENREIKEGEVGEKEKMGLFCLVFVSGCSFHEFNK